MSEPFSLHPGSEAAAVGLSVTPDEFPSAQNLLTPNEAFHASESHQDVNDSVEARSEFALSETSATQATSPLFSNGTLVDAEDWSNSSGNHEFARAGRSGSDFELDSSWSELGDSSSDEQMENQWSQAQGRHSPTALIA